MTQPAETLPNAATVGDAPASVRWSPWRAVVGFGVVSLAADMVYEGARSITGPLLASLGATAVLVGLITGAGEAMALVLRVVFGPLADRSGRYWTLTFAGYTLTAVCVPALAITPFLAGAGLAVACLLILAERAGKAVRSPAKTALLAHAAGAVGLGRGFAVHKALDQAGAVAGPLLVAAVAAARRDALAGHGGADRSRRRRPADPGVDPAQDARPGSLRERERACSLDHGPGRAAPSVASRAVVEADGALAFSETAGSGILRRIHARTSSAAAPGTISTAMAGQSVPARAATPATRSGPATAPAWSSALCTANPRPRPTVAAACASSAVLAGLRTAFPARSAKISRQATASPAPARNGVIAKAGTQTAVNV